MNAIESVVYQARDDRGIRPGCHELLDKSSVKVVQHEKWVFWIGCQFAYFSAEYSDFLKPFYLEITLNIGMCCFAKAEIEINPVFSPKSNEHPNLGPHIRMQFEKYKKKHYKTKFRKNSSIQHYQIMHFIQLNKQIIM
jgi:hypothetical protein